MLTRFLVWRTLGMLIVLVTMTVMVFLLRQVIPADPARAALGPNAPNAVVEIERKKLGLDQPLWVQYGRYMVGLLHGDLGQSVTTLNPVRDDIRRNLPASLELTITACIMATALAFGLAYTQTLLKGAALFRHGLLITASAPIFLTGLILLFVLWFKLGWFPSGGRTTLLDVPTGPTGLLTVDGLLNGRPDVTLNALWCLVLPGLTLALPMSVAIGRTLRSSIVGVLRQDHVRTARSIGLSEARVLRRHVLRNASTAAISMAGLQIGFLFANLIIVERIFSWPGLGFYLSEVLSKSDLSAILGVALVFGAAYVVINALVDFAQALVDPRVSLA
jgi:ABC-type dipeptide/oligopeptide/nickel transport system permease component